MEMEVTESLMGSLVPVHLLDSQFQGLCPESQNYFRSVVESNYQRGIVKTESGLCMVCYSTLTPNDHPRMKSALANKRKVSKILRKSELKTLGHYENYLLKKYLTSSVQQIVKCPVCAHVNKIPIMSNEGKHALKKEMILHCETVREVDNTPSSPVNRKQVKRKRKKEKMKLKKEKLDSGGLLTPLSNTADVMKTPKLLQNAPLTSSPLGLVLAQTSTYPGAHSSVSSSTSSSLPKLHHKLATSSVKSSFKRKSPIDSFSTPIIKQGNLNFPSGRHKIRESVTKTKMKQMKHKQLKEFLAQDQTPKKPASLTDFLSSL